MAANPYPPYLYPSQSLPSRSGFYPWLNRHNGSAGQNYMPSYHHYTHNLEEIKNICKIRFYHGSSFCGTVDMYINGMKTFKDMPFNSASSYLSLTPGAYYVEVFPSGTTYPLIMHRKITIGDTPNTVVLTGKEDDPRLVVIPENHTVPHNESKVKTLHLAPSHDILQIGVKGRDVLYPSLPYKHQTDYLGLTPMTIEFELKNPEKGELLHQSGFIQFEPDKVYTMIIYEDAEGTPGITLLH